jgi:hypothetical protein
MKTATTTHNSGLTCPLSSDHATSIPDTYVNAVRLLIVSGKEPRTFSSVSSKPLSTVTKSTVHVDFKFTLKPRTRAVTSCREHDQRRCQTAVQSHIQSYMTRSGAVAHCTPNQLSTHGSPIVHVRASRARLSAVSPFHTSANAAASPTDTAPDA